MRTVLVVVDTLNDFMRGVPEPGGQAALLDIHRRLATACPREFPRSDSRALFEAARVMG